MRSTPIYAALLALLFVVLSMRTVRLRQRLRVAVGDGGQALLTRAMRVHANFAEYVPIALLLIYFLEVHTEAGLMIHVLGVALLVGRVLHAYGVSQLRENLRFRVVGMILTFGVVIAASSALFVQGIRAAML